MLATVYYFSDKTCTGVEFCLPIIQWANKASDAARHVLVLKKSEKSLPKNRSRNLQSPNSQAVGRAVILTHRGSTGNSSLAARNPRSTRRNGGASIFSDAAEAEFRLRIGGSIKIEDQTTIALLTVYYMRSAYELANTTLNFWLIVIKSAW